MDLQTRAECIAYTNWLNTLHKSGYPKNKDGTSMNCWELYDYYFKLIKPEGGYVRDTFIQHAKTTTT